MPRMYKQAMSDNVILVRNNGTNPYELDHTFTPNSSWADAPNPIYLRNPTDPDAAHT